MRELCISQSFFVDAWCNGDREGYYALPPAVRTGADDVGLRDRISSKVSAERSALASAIVSIVEDISGHAFPLYNEKGTSVQARAAACW